VEGVGKPTTQNPDLAGEALDAQVLAAPGQAGEVGLLLGLQALEAQCRRGGGLLGIAQLLVLDSEREGDVLVAALRGDERAPNGGALSAVQLDAKPCQQMRFQLPELTDGAARLAEGDHVHDAVEMGHLGIRVRWSQHLPAQLQRLLRQRLRLGVAALAGVEPGQVVQAAQELSQNK
jgi:hypothetical protein